MKLRLPSRDEVRDGALLISAYRRTLLGFCDNHHRRATGDLVSASREVWLIDRKVGKFCDHCAAEMRLVWLEARDPAPVELAVAA